jgi:glycosyltransferase involved in cell wall biosynthesis
LKSIKIIYFYQYFSTSQGSWGTRVHEFTQEWVKNDTKVEVTVITSLYYKSDLKSRKLRDSQKFDGVNVEVLGINVNNKDCFVKRLFSFIAYALFSSVYALFGKYDVAIASSGPITVGLPGLIAKWVRRKKLVFEVRDLWPQGAIELGIIKNPFLIQLAYRFEKFCYRSSDLIVTLSPGMKDEVLGKLPQKRVISITNAANIELFSTLVEVDLLTYGLESKKYALYAGNIGKVNNVEWMLEAAKLLTESKSEIKIVFIGDGQLKAYLEGRKESENIDNLVFLPLMPKTELVGFIQNALVSLVPLANTPVLATSSPNKLFESLAAGVPVIITTQGWMREFVELEKVGIYVNPDTSVEMFKVLIDANDFLVRDRGFYVEVARKHFDKKKLAGEFLEEVKSI